MRTIFTDRGKCSWFGGPSDMGVRPMEGLALITPAEALLPMFAGLFVTEFSREKELARQLRPGAFYCAMRWDYSLTRRQVLQQAIVRVQSESGIVIWCRPCDWGPNKDTGRVIDLSQAALTALGLATDAIVSCEVLA